MARLLVYATQLLNSGGIESHLFEFCRVMSSNGHKLDMIVPKCRLDKSRKEKLQSYVNTLYFSDSNNNGLLFLWLLLKSLQLGRIRYDTVYTNGQGDTILWVSRLFRHKKWVHHHHTSGDDHDLAMWSKSYYQTVMKCNTLIVCSELILKRLLNKINRSITCIPVFSRKLDIATKPGNTSKHRVRFGYFGRLIPEKGIDFICRLSNDASCQHISFHVWGTGSEEIINRFRDYPNLNYHGAFNDKAELQEIVSGLDGYLLLSTHHEGLPVSLLEVMSAGLPWLATDKGGIHELFVDQLSTRIIHATSSYEEIKAAVLKFADDCRSGIIDTKALMLKYEQNYAASTVFRKWNLLMSY
jgi:glycosyltransferase involved in cell wall biosynthesis